MSTVSDKTKQARVCIAGIGALVAASTAYNLRTADATAFGYLTFILAPLCLGVAVWLAHTVNSRALSGLAGAIAVACFAISSKHIYDGAVYDGADQMHAILLPVIVDGLAIMLTVGYLLLRRDVATARADEAERVAAERAAEREQREQREREQRAETERLRAAAEKRRTAGTKDTQKLEPVADKKLTTEQRRAHVARLRADGQTVEQIRLQLGCGEKTVRRDIKALEASAA